MRRGPPNAPAAVEIGSVRVNSMSQLDQAMGGPESWSNVILGASMRVFLDEINFGITD